MKTISKRFLKASLAMLLVVVMLFGSTLTGFAASVDNADTKANVDKTEIGSTIGNMSDVYFTGEFNSWSTSSHKLTKHDANHYSGTFYIARGDGELSFKLYIVGPGWNGYFSKGDSSYGSNTTTTSLEQGKNDDKISCVTAASGFIKITVDFYGEYGGNSRLNIKQSAVSEISASVNPTSTTLTSGETVTIKPSATGGTGSFSYSYAKSGGTLSATSGSSTVFTAPTVTSNTTYTVETTVKDSNCSGLTTTVTTTITVKPKTYTVTYNTNGGTGNIASQTKTHGVALTLTSSKPTPPTGKTFKEWNTKQDGTGIAYASGASYTDNAAVTLYAQYTVSDVYYTFYDYDKTTVLKEKTKITSGGTPVPPASPTRDHYTFAGWSPAVNPITQDTNYYATYTPFEYTITLNTDGGTITGNNPITYTVETATFDLPTPEKTGYDFIKWVDGNNNEYSSIAKGSTGDLELTAKYQIKTYTISASASNAEGGTVTIDGSEVDSVTVEYGKTVRLNATAKTGYDFRGWKRVGNDTTVDYNNPLIINPDSNAEFIANFVKVWEVEVVLPEGASKVQLAETVTANPGNLVFTFNDGVKTTPTVTLTDDTYEHRGWKVTQNDVTTTHTVNAIEVTIDSDTIIEPIVVKTYKATSKAYTTHVDISDSNTYGGIVKINGISRSTTVDRGATVTYKAEPYANYEFIGWYNSDDFTTNDPITTNSEYTVTEDADKDIYLVALFARVYKLSGAYNAKFAYNAKENKYSFVADNYVAGTFNILSDSGEVDTSVTNGGNTIGGTLTGSASPFTFTIGEDFDPDKSITFDLTSKNGGRSFVLDITAQYRNAYNVSFASGINGTGNGPYRSGQSVLLTVDCAEDMAIGSYSFKTDDDFVAPVDAQKVGDKQIAFTMPEGNVELNVVLAKMFKVYADSTNDTGLTENARYYLPGESIVYPLTPTSAKVSIMTDTIALIPNTEFTSTVGENGIINLHFTMPNEDVKVQATTKASYQVIVASEIKDYFNTDGANYCSVEVKAFGITDDNYVANNTVVTLKASTKYGNNQDYTFLGYYDNEDKLVSENPVYSFVPQDDINYTAVFVRNVYIVGDVAEGEDVFTPMEYDIDTDTYSYEPDVAKGTFIITPVADPDSSSYNTVWKATSPVVVGTNLTHSNNYGTLNGVKSGYTMPLTLTFSKKSAGNYEVLAEAKEVAANVYLSSGRLDYERKQGEYFSTNTQFIDYEGQYTVGEKKSAVNETYIPADLPQKNMTIRVQTTISGSRQNLYDVEYFYVYDVDSKKPSAVKATPYPGGVYEASIEVKGTSFIVPLYFANENYVQQFGGKRVQIYVDPREITGDTSINWGDFMACYPYGRNAGDSSDHDLTGHWPGQLMIPLDDGTFKTSVVIGDGTSETLSGLVFNNYLSDKDTDRSAATLIKDKLGMSGLEFVQTYDYKEAVYLDREGYNVITYKLKKNLDGYHGNRMNTESGTASGDYKVNTNTNIDLGTTKYVFEPLRNRQGTYPMDFNGESIKTENPQTAYYVVSEGDVDVNIGNTYDSAYSGDWTAIWHVYDSNGTYKCNVMSGGMYDQVDKTKSKLAQALGLTNADLAGKQVMITYEAKNKTNYYRVDGQWYGEKTSEDKIKASVEVGLYDDGTFHENIQDNPDTPNINENYGQAFINHQGGTFQTVELEYATGSTAIELNLSGQRFGNYKIKGWYTKNAKGEYVEFQKGGSSAKLTIGGDTVVYAFFEELVGNQLTVDHEIYTNTNDREILAGGGTGERTVEIWSYDPVTKKPIERLDGYTSINGSSASAPITEDESYLVRVKVNPLGADKFNAWYMDATRADGTPTFEEVFTDGNTVNSEDEVVAEFVYTYKPDTGMPTHIVIYSDLKEVSLNGKLIYIYKNRYGKERFITETIKMSPQEIDGFAGNNNTARLPAYKEYMIYEIEVDGIPVREKVYTAERAEELSKEGYTMEGTGSQIGEYLPSLHVTEAINIETQWIVNEEYYKFKQEDSTIEIYAEQNPMQFTLTATIDGKTYTKTDYYNTLLEDLKCSDGTTIEYLDAPLKNSKGESFSYWQSYEEVGGVKFTKIISYSPYYRYRFIEDRTIEAVYGEDITDAWTPSIEDVTYTREYGDGGDYIYTDYLVALHSSIDEKIEDIRKDPNRPFTYGLVLVRDPEVTVTKDNYQIFTDYPTYDGIEADVKAVAEGGKSTKVYDEKNNNKDYNAYYFEFSDEPVTNFNRLVHAIKYDNNHKNDYKTYAFSSYAYLIIDGHTYISAPENVNFYGLAIENVYDQQQ